MAIPSQSTATSNCSPMSCSRIYCSPTGFLSAPDRRLDRHASSLRAPDARSGQATPVPPGTASAPTNTAGSPTSQTGGDEGEEEPDASWENSEVRHVLRRACYAVWCGSCPDMWWIRKGSRREHDGSRHSPRHAALCCAEGERCDRCVPGRILSSHQLRLLARSHADGSSTLLARACARLALRAWPRRPCLCPEYVSLTWRAHSPTQAAAGAEAKFRRAEAFFSDNLLTPSTADKRGSEIAPRTAGVMERCRVLGDEVLGVMCTRSMRDSKAVPRLSLG